MELSLNATIRTLFNTTESTGEVVDFVIDVLFAGTYGVSTHQQLNLAHSMSQTL